MQSTTNTAKEMQLVPAFWSINDLIEFLSEKEGKIEPYPDVKEDLERLQDLIGQAQDALTNLSESLD
ncbi:MAG: hypothetical protein ACOVOV_01610 [Dolichospermum sp.]